MEQVSKLVVRQCDCKCCMFVVDKTVWEDGSVDYNISIQDSRYDHGYNTLWGRIKRAVKALFGKPVYFNDVYLAGEKQYAELVREMTALEDFTYPGEVKPVPGSSEAQTK